MGQDTMDCLPDHSLTRFPQFLTDGKHRTAEPLSDLQGLKHAFTGGAVVEDTKAE